MSQSSLEVVAQLAEDGDTVNDVTIQWPEAAKWWSWAACRSPSRCSMKLMNRSRLSSTQFPAWTASMPSDDPLLELRAAVYLLSGRRRRAAPE